MITEQYKDKMFKFMGDKSKDWIEELKGHLDYFISKWSLKDIQVMDLSYNMVIGANSSLHGDIVLKICLPGFEFLTEYYALKELNREMMVRLIDVDIERRALVLDNLKPGHTLWQLPYDQRLDYAADILYKTPSTDFTYDYPTFLAFTEKMDGYVKEKSPDHKMNDHLQYLIDHFEDLNVDNNPVSLLHGDLHHGNILLDDQWTVIDPKGMIGYRSLEVGRYMNNQVGEKGIDVDQSIEDMIKSFSRRFNLDEKTMLLSFYADLVLSTSWYFEDHIIDEEGINEKLQVITKVHKKLIQI